MRVTDLLRTMDIFEALASEELETIAQLLRERRLAESEVLCRQGHLRRSICLKPDFGR